jgi:nucleotide-binding universal stress UspA family protein
MTLANPIRPKVLAAWDGSTAAATAFPVAQALAQQLDAAVEILFVAPKTRDRDGDMDAHLDEAKRMGFSVNEAIGDAATEIIRATEEPGVLLVVLTTHGRELESDYRLGSVAEKVVSRTTRPVLIVKPESLATATPRSLKRLLVPIDGTPKTAAALKPVTELAAVLGASIDLLYVSEVEHKASTERGAMTAPLYVDQAHHEWPEWAGEVIHRLATVCADCPEGIPLRMFLVTDGTGDEIARFATENEHDAIILVRRSRFQPGRAKVIRSVLSQASCLIVVVGGEET